MGRYTYQQIQIDGPFKVAKVLDFSMDAGVNQHGQLEFTGLISDLSPNDIANMNFNNAKFKVYLNNELEFCGYPANVITNNTGSVTRTWVTLNTLSKRMDHVPRKRFYQNPDHTFADILNESYKDSRLGYLADAKGSRSILKPILQYDETDWEFTMRMAGNENTLIIPDLTMEEPKIIYGIPKGRPIEETTEYYRMIRNPEKYLTKRNMVKSISYSDFYGYLIKSKNNYKLGDHVNFQGRDWIVAYKMFRRNNSGIEAEYLLSTENEFSVPMHYNMKIAGLELVGTVEQSQGQELKLKLDIDQARNPKCKTWFEYAPITNNAIYSMPIKGEKVLLKWQSFHDSSAKVISCVRKNGDEMPSPRHRHMRTEDDIHLSVLPTNVNFTTPSGSMKMLYTGFEIGHDGLAEFSSEANIELRGRNILLSSPEMISGGILGSTSRLELSASKIEGYSENTSTYSMPGSEDLSSPQKLIPPFTISREKAEMLISSSPTASNVSDK